MGWAWKWLHSELDLKVLSRRGGAEGMCKLIGGRSWLRANAEEGRGKSGRLQTYVPRECPGPFPIVSCRSRYTVGLSQLRRRVSTQKGTVLCGWKGDNSCTAKAASTGVGGGCGCRDVFLSLGGQPRAHPQERSWRSFLPLLWVIGQAALACKSHIQGQIEPLRSRCSHLRVVRPKAFVMETTHR